MKQTLTLDWKQYTALARQTAAEGCVLLKNTAQALPIRPGETVSVFGRIQLDYYKSGTGSGGLVNVTHTTGILEGLRACSDIRINEALAAVYEEWSRTHPFDSGSGWGQEPWCQQEMPVTETLVREAQAVSDLALIIIGRTAGEDQDNQPAPGSYYLTDIEQEMLSLVCRIFPRTAVVFNTGNLMDMSWQEEISPSAILYVWQGGMEGGHGAAQVLTGAVSPSGKLPDTIAKRLSDYPSDSNFGDPVRNFYQEDLYIGYRYFETFAPEAVQYPFGYGLSYTSFSICTDSLEEQQDRFLFSLRVTNTGNCSGKEVVQLYASAPQGQLGKPARVLVGFQKTELLAPGACQQLLLSVPKYRIASYDDSGVTGHPYAYVLEAGQYTFFVGGDVRNASPVGDFLVPNTLVLEQLTQNLAPVLPFSRLRPKQSAESIPKNGQTALTPSWEEAPLRKEALLTRQLRERPSSTPYSGNQGFTLQQVGLGEVTMEEFLSQLTDRELSIMVHGEGMSSPKVTPGTAAAFGGLTPELSAYGIPIGCCTDGPSGMRLDCGATAFSLPNGTLLASTFNTSLVRSLFCMEGMEMRSKGIDTLLGPGMNLHRHPLNGRNFEYFSEDPLLTGLMAVAELNGMSTAGVTGTIKHFCANNQEFHRHDIDSVVSERALRELYLKGFEIAIREGAARSIMTTYGAVNGLWTAGSYDLVTRILRQEWGFTGIVMTDWWAKINEEGQEANHTNLAAMVRAQNDLFMVVPDAVSYEDNLQQALQDGSLTRAELVRCAANICRFLLESPCMERFLAKQQATQPNADEQMSDVVILHQPEDAMPLPSSNLRYETLADCLTLSLAALPPIAGKTPVYGFHAERGGHYRISLTACSQSGELAQLPAAIYIDGTSAAVCTFTGNGQSQTITRSWGTGGSSNHYLFLSMRQSGLQLKELKLEYLEEA